MRDYWDNLKLFNRNLRFFLLGTAVVKGGALSFNIFIRRGQVNLIYKQSAAKLRGIELCQEKKSWFTILFGSK